MYRQIGNIVFEKQPSIISYASVAGGKESEGPLKNSFDYIFSDSYAGQNTFEQAESVFTGRAVEIAMDKADMRPIDIDTAFCGDLLNQCIASSFAMRRYGVRYAGIYGACSTMGLGLIMAAISVESGASGRALSAASSHYCTAERQYRFPLEYGSQRPPTAQWTVTAAGACIVADDPKDVSAPYISAARLGRIIDFGIKDQNNMGAAMAPATADTIYGFFRDSGTGPSDYDRIFTGDLGRIGSRLLRDLLAERGIDIDDRHSDCGVMIFDESQDVHAGGSGCGCCASVLCGKILGDMTRGEYHNILFVPTGALLSPTTVMQKQTIPSVAHLVNIRI